jgi:hypothetical protein
LADLVQDVSDNADPTATENYFNREAAVLTRCAELHCMVFRGPRSLGRENRRILDTLRSYP